jgi:choline dehydrogenase-like flavoprotein
MDHYDAIIVGSGAGGGTLARHLAPSGKRILLLERGDWLPREPQNWSAANVFVDNRYVSPDTWYDAEGKPFQPQVHYCVGGATKMYGAALYRMRAEDFGELRHHGGISPAWPIPYEAMEPYYTKAEQLYQVHGARGEDPTEPFASAPYDHPAVSHEPRIAQLAESFAAVGLHPFHAPCGVMLNEGNMPYSNCVRCSTCDGFPCLVHAKSDAEVLGVRPALEHPNVTLLTGAEVVALSTNPAGTAVTEVVVKRAGEDGGTGEDGDTGGGDGRDTGGDDGKGWVETYTADIVVVSCGAANTAKLLLGSATEKHPNGLANGSDQVGRNYMFHNSQAVLAISKEPNPTVFQKTLGVNDYYFASDAWEFPMGNIQMVGKSVADMYRGEKPLMTRLAPTFSLADVAEHAVDFWLSTEDIPQAENRVSVDREGKLTLSYRASNDTARNRLFEQLRSLLGHLGMHEHHLIPRWAYLENKIPVAGVAHQAGTCRFGSDPASSALNTDCRAHELDNLYVVDTSFFPSISAVNPALTAMANALRVGDHLLQRLGANGA